MSFVFPPHPVVSLPIAGTADRFPVRRIFCVGRNYADHAREMGAVDQADGREPPFFFMKPADALVSGEGEIAVAFPPLTDNLHHEVEMIVALGSGGASCAKTSPKLKPSEISSRIATKEHFFIVNSFYKPLIPPIEPS